MTRHVLAFLFESDLPVALQVFWKLLLFGTAALISIEVIPNVKSVGGQILLSVIVSVFFVSGVFLKLGEG